jgi:hypothetical protein
MSVETLFSSGLAADLVLIVMLLEWVALSVWHKRTGRGVAPFDLLINLGAGAGLALAFRGALVGAALPWIGAALIAACAFHVADQLRRANRAGSVRN